MEKKSLILLSCIVVTQVNCQFLHAQKTYRTKREKYCAACKQKNVRRGLHHRGGPGKLEGAAFPLSTQSCDSKNPQPPHRQRQTSSAEAGLRSENPDIGDSRQVCERAGVPAKYTQALTTKVNTAFLRPVVLFSRAVLEPGASQNEVHIASRPGTPCNACGRRPLAHNLKLRVHPAVHPSTS